MKWYLIGSLLLSGLRGCSAQPAAPAAPTFSPADYRLRLRALDARRQQLGRRYRQAPSAAGRAACLAKARTLFLAALDSTIFPAWEGTPWAFYGQSWEPRRGSIACGYFVTTTLHDAGLHLQRSLLAKQASEVIIKNLTAETYIHRYRGLDQAEFVRQVRALGPGLYVLGLDFHAGFLRVRDDGTVQMVHSSYLGPATVTREAAEAAEALASTYRVVGKVSADGVLLRAWLLGRPLAVRGATVRK
ncbi:hypothetical protein [Hymenobacter jeollabukensis]|uniref:Uncharacterized protein n=1 Tax=Hymenobacter jeollabukensis TaxID=2025313 RepID=A0A5R8WWW5_9BACT|nr:hypothetical protein [Hymenobacter jeollabukensis]TLM97027.1 hypothetical protein FDY95_03290 [Hymenobacter jeollabukensis]